MEQELIPKLFSGQPGKYLIFTQATRGHVALFQEEKERARGGKACGVNGFARDRAGYAPAPPSGGLGSGVFATSCVQHLAGSFRRPRRGSG